MTTYRNIHGRSIQAVTTDPTESVAEGQIWYNTASDTFKSVLVTEAWSSAATLPGNRTYGGGAGSQTAALAFGGANNPPGSATDGTFEYNGTGWSNGGDLPAVSDLCGGLGTQTAGLKTFGRSGGSATTEAFEYNGSTWTATGNGSDARWGVGSAGIQTAAIAFGGFYTPPYTWFNNTEKYNGSAWTASGALATARSQVGFLGDAETSALCIGGETPPSFGTTNIVEGYNGSTWSSETNYPASSQGSAGVGSESAGLVFAPSPNSTNAFKYDGTTFTAAPSLGNGRQNGSRAGTTSAALAFGGNNGSGGNFTEEFNKSANVITPSAWASGGNLNTARQRAASAGASQTSALAFGGFEAPPNGPPLNNSETYNGTAWSEGNNLGTARGNTSGFGTATAAVCGPGRGTPSGPFIQNTEEYDGTSWTAGNNSNTSGAAARSASGTLTAGLICGGFTPPSAAPAEHVNNVEEYDGTNWTNATVMPQYQAYNCQCGTQTATLNGGGNAGPNGPTVNTNAISLDYDGTNWTAGPNANILSDKFTAYNGGTGTQTSALFIGGDGTTSARFDGTAFSTDAAYPAARGETNSAGSAPSNSALVYAGSPVPGVGNSTIEYSAETTTVNVKTLTQS